MTVVTSKVCVVGDFAVGKTSVVERFVNNQFSEKYLTTVGVKVDTKEVEHEDLGVAHKLIIWDVAGSDRFDHAAFAYLRGASGIVYVVDGTRSETARAASDLRVQITEEYGPAPGVLLVNKKDLTQQWELGDERVAELESEFGIVYRTSAKTGDDVETALQHLAAMIIENDLRRR